MAYIGNQPTDNFVTFATQNFSTSATSSYTLSHAVSNENEIALFINNVRQHPGSGKAYTASGTALTLSANTASTDVMYCIFLGRAIQSTVPATNSITGDMLGTSFTITTTDNSDTLTLKSTDADATKGPVLALHRDSASPADNDIIGQIDFVGENSADEAIDYVSIFAKPSDVTDGTEDFKLIVQGKKAGTDRNLLQVGEDEIVVNEDSVDTDFRAESNGNTHGLFLQASDGMVGFGTSSGSISNAGIKIFGTESGESNTGGMNIVAQGGNDPLALNRLGGDGDLISLRSETTEEGTVAVSGSTVSYNTFTGTHWSRLADNSKPTILKGTVMETLDTMCDWYNLEFEVTEGGSTFTEKVPHALTASQSAGDKVTYNHNGTDYEATIVKEDDIKHVQTKISTTDEAKNVYGVFHAWDIEAYNDMMVAAVGTYVVRIHKDETVAKGDLLQSNGDGTAKKQSDDNIKSRSFAKVLSNTKIETYSDGSYIVPCSLMC